MPAVHPHAHLQGVIRGTRCGFCLVNVEQTGVNRPRHIEIHSIWTVESADWTVWKCEPNARRSRIESCDLGLVRLVDVAETEELGSPGADITNLEYRLTRLLL